MMTPKHPLQRTLILIDDGLARDFMCECPRLRPEFREQCVGVHGVRSLHMVAIDWMEEQVAETPHSSVGR